MYSVSLGFYFEEILRNTFSENVMLLLIPLKRKPGLFILHYWFLGSLVVGYCFVFFCSKISSTATSFGFLFMFYILIRLWSGHLKIVTMIRNIWYFLYHSFFFSVGGQGCRMFLRQMKKRCVWCDGWAIESLRRRWRIWKKTLISHLNYHFFPFSPHPHVRCS